MRNVIISYCKDVVKIFTRGRQTEIAKNLATFCKKYFLIIFLINLLVYVLKELESYVNWYFHNYSLKVSSDEKHLLFDKVGREVRSRL